MRVDSGPEMLVTLVLPLRDRGDRRYEHSNDKHPAPLGQDIQIGGAWSSLRARKTERETLKICSWRFHKPILRVLQFRLVSYCFRPCGVWVTRFFTATLLLICGDAVSC